MEKALGIIVYFRKGFRLIVYVARKYGYSLRNTSSAFSL